MPSAAMSVMVGPREQRPELKIAEAILEVAEEVKITPNFSFAILKTGSSLVLCVSKEMRHW